LQATRRDDGFHQRLPGPATPRVFVDSDVIDMQFICGDAPAEKTVEVISRKSVGAASAPRH
jgi:hypothetical protein